MDKVVAISVVRDWAMYARCLKGNAFLSDAELCPLDNRDQNEAIPVRYNQFLDARPSDEDAWYVFCHEDFQLLEPLAPLLADCDRDALWGPIGAATRVRFGVYHQWRLLGAVEECRKDGSNIRRIGEAVPRGTQVDTFDCQCLIVHSSLVRRLELRFDAALSFDLYVEEFCMAAHEKGGVASRILPLKCRHWSGGGERPAALLRAGGACQRQVSECLLHRHVFMDPGRQSADLSPLDRGAETNGKQELENLRPITAEIWYNVRRYEASTTNF